MDTANPYAINNGIIAAHPRSPREAIEASGIAPAGKKITATRVEDVLSRVARSRAELVRAIEQISEMAAGKPGSLASGLQHVSVTLQDHEDALANAIEQIGMTLLELRAL